MNDTKKATFDVLRAGTLNRLLTAAAICTVAVGSQTALATPSTVLWSPATTYIQPFATPHITYDSYFNDKAAYPADLGFEIGILPFSKFQIEVGFDAFLPYYSPLTDASFFVAPATPFQLNAKACLPENAFGEYFPGICAGIYGVGFTTTTSFDIVHLEVGKTFFFGAFTIGGYYGLPLPGTDVLWTGSEGVQRLGIMGSYVSPDVVLDLKGLYKLNFFADVMSGKNAFGAVAAGIGIYFTPAIDILTGPVYFFDETMQPPFGTGGGSKLMWTVQLDVDIDFTPNPKPATPIEPATAPEPAKS